MSAAVRDHRLDVARGAAIVAIVVVHVVRGLSSAGLIDDDIKMTVDRSVGLWCLTAFAFVGGTLIPRAVEKRGMSAYLRDRVMRLLAVYLLWTLMQGSVQLLAGDAVNNGRSFAGVLQVWRPDGHLWYLPFLILATVVFVPLRPWLPRRGAVALVIGSAISLIWWGYDGGYIGTQGLGLVVFFIAGMVAGTARVQDALDRLPASLSAVLSVSVLVLTAVVCVRTTAILPTFYWFQATPTRVAIGVVLAVAATAAILLFGYAGRAVAFLALCGRRSLDIYLAHIILASGTRIVLVKLGVEQLWLIIVLCLLAGVLGSLAVSSVCRRLRLGWVFDGPDMTTPRRSQPPQNCSAS
ncbi:acyltransferase family protein [Mycobacterium sp. C31M]